MASALVRRAATSQLRAATTTGTVQLPLATLSVPALRNGDLSGPSTPNAGIPAQQRSITNLFRPITQSSQFARSSALTFATKSTPPLTQAEIIAMEEDDELDGGPLTSPVHSYTEDVKSMTNEQLSDPTTIPGWDLIHSPPRKLPRGALVGTVVSDKMSKTVNVAVDRYRIVPKYRKRLRYTRKFMAHDEEELCSMGDLVMIVPSQRISKMKHFMVREIIRAKGAL